MTNANDGDGSETGGGGAGNGEAFGSEDATKVESGRTPTQIELAKLDGAAFNRIADRLDALGADLREIPAILAGLSRHRRSNFLWVVIMRLDYLSTLVHETRHELHEMKRAVDAQKDPTP